MLGPLQDALDHADLPAPLRAQLDLAHRNSLRLLKLVNSLLDFARIEAGRVTAAFEPVDLAAITTDLASNFRSAMERAGLSLRSRLPAAARAGARRPRNVGKDRPQPAVERFQVHARGPGLAEAAPRWRSRAAGSRGHGLRRGRAASCRGCSSASIASKARRPAPTRARASAWRWSRSWSGCTAARSRLKASPVTAATFRVRIPFGIEHLPIGQRRDRALTGLHGHWFAGLCAGGTALAARFRCRAGRAGCAVSPQPPPAPKTGASPRPSARACVLADDNADMRNYVRELLGPLYDDRSRRRRHARRSRPRGAAARTWCISDVMMPKLDGLGLLQALRADAGAARRAGDPAVGARRRRVAHRRPERRRRRLCRQAVRRARTAGARRRAARTHAHPARERGAPAPRVRDSLATERRIPRHAGARAAQSAGADPQCRRTPVAQSAGRTCRCEPRCTPSSAR